MASQRPAVAWTLKLGVRIGPAVQPYPSKASAHVIILCALMIVEHVHAWLWISSMHFIEARLLLGQLTAAAVIM